MDKFGRTRRFHGMDKFHLANSVQDPSYLSELICGELFRAAGVPASRIGHAVVTINGRKRGLYYLKEGYDRDFLQNALRQQPAATSTTAASSATSTSRCDLISHQERREGPRRPEGARRRRPRAGPRQALRRSSKSSSTSTSSSATWSLEAIIWDWDGYPVQVQQLPRLPRPEERTRSPSSPRAWTRCSATPNGPIDPGLRRHGGPRTDRDAGGPQALLRAARRRS